MRSTSRISVLAMAAACGWAVPAHAQRQRDVGHPYPVERARRRGGFVGDIGQAAGGAGNAH